MPKTILNREREIMKRNFIIEKKNKSHKIMLSIGFEPKINLDS